MQVTPDLFAEDALPALREAGADYAWLLERGYASDAALKLVGDRRSLADRQRMALRRAICAPSAAAARRAKRIELEGASIAVDGYNVLVTVEVALSGGMLIVGSDGWLRDLAGMHGRHRAGAITEQALALLAGALRPAAEVIWYFDAPVSGSGALAGAVRALGFRAEAVPSPDRALAVGGLAAATADGPLLDRCVASVDLVGRALAGRPGLRVVSLN